MYKGPDGLPLAHGTGHGPYGGGQQAGLEIGDDRVVGWEAAGQVGRVVAEVGSCRHARGSTPPGRGIAHDLFGHGGCVCCARAAWRWNLGLAGLGRGGPGVPWRLRAMHRGSLAGVQDDEMRRGRR